MEVASALHLAAEAIASRIRTQTVRRSAGNGPRLDRLYERAFDHEQHHKKRTGMDGRLSSTKATLAAARAALPLLEARDGAIIAKDSQVLIASAAGRIHRPMNISAESRQLTEEIIRRANAYPKLIETIKREQRSALGLNDAMWERLDALLRDLGEAE